MTRTTSFGRRVGCGFALAVAFLPGGPPPQAHPGLDEQTAALDARILDDPSNAELFLRRGEVHRLHGNWDAAEADFLRARALDPGLAVVDLHLARLALDSGAIDAAKRAADRFLAQRPGHGEGLLIRARALERDGKHRSAARDYDLAIAALASADMAQPDHYLERARVLEAAGAKNLAEALRGLDEGWERLGHPVTLQLHAIELELERKRYDAALQRLALVAEGASRQETWLVRRGEILEMAGRPQDARQAYASALAAIETLPQARRWNRAVLRLQEQAETALNRLPSGG